eukprot:9477188-Pyramimonas_sp.AAC.1
MGKTPETTENEAEVGPAESAGREGMTKKSPKALAGVRRQGSSFCEPPRPFRGGDLPLPPTPTPSPWTRACGGPVERQGWPQKVPRRPPGAQRWASKIAQSVPNWFQDFSNMPPKSLQYRPQTARSAIPAPQGNLQEIKLLPKRSKHYDVCLLPVSILIVSECQKATPRWAQ